MRRLGACFSKDEMRSVLEVLVTNTLKSKQVEAAVLAEQEKAEPVGLIRVCNGDVVHMEPYAACIDMPSGGYPLYLRPAPAPEGPEEARVMAIYRAIKMLPEKDKEFMEHWVHSRAAIAKEKAE